MRVKWGIGFMMAALVAGCGKEAGEEKAVPSVATPPAVRPQADGQTFQAEVEALLEPNQYRVHLHWPALSHSETWIVQRRDSHDRVKTIGRFDGDVTETVDVAVMPGETYRYQLSASEQSSWHRTDSADLTIPRDIEVRGVVALSELRAQRLFLRAGSTLRFENRAAAIVVDELVAEGGTIESFAAGAQAAAGQPGRPGGWLSITARTGHGALPIALRGENGGEGKPGQAGSVGAKGADGTAAVAEVQDQNLLFQVTHEYVPYPGINPTPPDFHWKSKPAPPNDAPVWKAIERCMRAPQPGAPGALGSAGQDGIAGGIGGNAGQLSVTIEHPETLQILPVFIAGKGGIGRGGEGGGRGPNGANGAADAHHVCPEAVALPPGTGQGPRGKDVSAADGDGTQHLCLRLGGVNSGDCAASK